MDSSRKWADKAVGSTIGARYRLDGILGTGGMGAVFKGVHLGMGRPVAVKLLTPRLRDHPKAIVRFQQEARAAAATGRSGVVDVLDFDIDPNHGPYLVMERLEGESLAQRIQRVGRLQPVKALTIAADILDVLVDVHAHDIIHRDLKPANIFIARTDEGGEVVKLLDFGISRIVSVDQKSRLTAPGAMMGTLRYMAPEQAECRPDVDHRADLYSLGLILYQLIGGYKPFHSVTVDALLLAVVLRSPTPLRELVSGVDEDLHSFIDKAIRKPLKGRFQSAGEMKAVIATLLDRPSISQGKITDLEFESSDDNLGEEAYLPTAQIGRGSPAAGPTRPLTPQSAAGPTRPLTPQSAADFITDLPGSTGNTGQTGAGFKPVFVAPSAAVAHPHELQPSPDDLSEGVEYSSVKPVQTDLEQGGGRAKSLRTLKTPATARGPSMQRWLFVLVLGAGAAVVTMAFLTIIVVGGLHLRHAWLSENSASQDDTIYLLGHSKSSRDHIPSRLEEIIRMTTAMASSDHRQGNLNKAEKILLVTVHRFEPKVQPRGGGEALALAEAYVLLGNIYASQIGVVPIAENAKQYQKMVRSFESLTTKSGIYLIKAHQYEPIVDQCVSVVSGVREENQGVAYAAAAKKFMKPPPEATYNPNVHLVGKAKALAYSHLKIAGTFYDKALGYQSHGECRAKATTGGTRTNLRIARLRSPWFGR